MISCHAPCLYERFTKLHQKYNLKNNLSQLKEQIKFLFIEVIQIGFCKIAQKLSKLIRNTFGKFSAFLGIG